MNKQLSFLSEIGLSSYLLNLLSSFKRSAFTLAETLIVLAVVGVVAALTIPSIVENYQKHRVEIQVKKFYVNMNNAIRTSTVSNGEVELWMPEAKSQSYEQTLNFMKTYILPYLQYERYYKCQISDAYYRVCVQLLDGSMFDIRTDLNGTDVGFYINGKLERNTRNWFAFQLNKIGTEKYSQRTFMEPYIFQWNGDLRRLKENNQFRCAKDNEGMAAYCTKLIQLNNWKIPDDYPW